MRQKFRMLSFVHVTNDMPIYMQHFPKGFKGIVHGTYSQMFGGENIKSYSIYQTKDNKIVNQISWYEENQLKLCKKQNRKLAEEMIEEYNFRKEE